MGCNCGKSSAKQEFVYQNGKVTKVYRTEVEARAAVIRNNGGTVTTRPKS